MGPLTDRLMERLELLQKLLEQAGEEYWPALLRQAAELIGKEDIGGVENLLGLYGGMGSFSDLVLHPLNGHRVAEEDLDRVNRQLTELRSGVFRLARDIRHSYYS